MSNMVLRDASASKNSQALHVRLLAATTLRNVLGTKNLGDILSERHFLSVFF